MLTLLYSLGLEWVTPKYIYFNVWLERVCRTNYFRSSISHCILCCSVCQCMDIIQFLSKYATHYMKYLDFPLERPVNTTAVNRQKVCYKLRYVIGVGADFQTPCS
jgi:hypothetical protein